MKKGKQTWELPITKHTMQTAIKLSLCSLIFLAFSCTSSVKESKENANDSISNIWRKDSIGCKQLRTKELAIALIKHNGLMKKGKEEFLKVFYLPNETSHMDDTEILKYYFNSISKKGKLAPNSDMCYANFYFKSNKLVETHFVCE